MLTALVVVTTTAVGLLVGVELAVAVVLNPVLLALPAGACLEGRAHGGRMLGRAMPFWYVGSLVLTALVVVAAWGTATATAALLAAVLLAASVVLSVALLVPLNDRAKTWTAQEHPADWREQMRRWDRLHVGRVAIIVVAFALLAVAAAAL